MDFKQEAIKHFQKFNTNPFLFIGSGLSRRYYNLPTWLSLLENFYNTLPLTVPFQYYLSKANGDPVRVATLLAEELHELWWRSPTFRRSRNQYSNDATTLEAPLKIELAKYVLENSVINKAFSDEIDLFKTINFDGIITTNWDDFLNNIFPENHVYIGQQELLFSEAISVGETYKIHGCTSKPTSLVLTDSDYDSFLKKYPYLAAKLLTIFLEHPIIFLGYSLSDLNVIEIIDSIVRCIDDSNVEKLKDRLIFVEWINETVDPSISDGVLALKDSTILPIKLIKLNSFIPLFEILQGITRRLPLKVLKLLKDSVYDFVKTNKPSKKLYIGDLNSTSDYNGIEFVVGIGEANRAFSDHGYKGIDVNDIIEDVINDGRKYDAVKLLTETFPVLGKGSTFIPLCKYLKEANGYAKNGSLNQAGIAYASKFNYRNNMPTCFLPPKTYSNKRNEIRPKYKSVSAIVSNYDEQHALLYIQYLDRKNIDLEELRAFLVKCYPVRKLSHHTNYRKLVCLYDFYKHCD